MNEIPVKQTIAEAYRFTFYGLERVIGLIWLPAVLMTVGSYFVISPYLTGMANAMEASDLSQIGPQMAMVFVFSLIRLVLMAMIGVAITREILNPLQRPLFLRFGLGAAEFRLVGAIIGLVLLALVFAVVVGLVAGMIGLVLNALLPGAGGKGAVGAIILVALLFLPLFVYLFLRLAFLVTPCVVMEDNFGIERSWQLTKGNVWRIIGICLAIWVPLMIVYAIGQAVIMGPEYFNPHFGLAGDEAAQLKHSVENLRQTASKLPLLIGFEFLMLPFVCGLSYGSSAFAYRALMAQEKKPE